MLRAWNIPISFKGVLAVLREFNYYLSLHSKEAQLQSPQLQSFSSDAAAKDEITDQLSKDRRSVTLLRRTEHVLMYPQGRTAIIARASLYSG